MLDLALASHMLTSTPASDQKTLLEWGLADGGTVYASWRHAHGAQAAGSACFSESGAGRLQARLPPHPTLDVKSPFSLTPPLPLRP